MAKFYDVALSEYILNPGRKILSLEEYSLQNFDIEISNEESLTHKWEFLLNQISKKNISNYSTELLFSIEKLKKSQKIDENDEKILREIDFPLMQVLAKIEQNWVKVDVENLKEIWEYLKKEISIEEQNIFSLSWENFNIASPKQVWVILFEKLWLPTWKKTKTWYSVDLEVLEWLSFKYPIAKHILNHRQYSKLLSTYVEWLQKLIDKKTQRIHTSYNQAITSTWRLSSTNPNLQNIPSSSSWISSLIRKAFVPFEDGDLIMAFDYSQIEVRLLAIMSWDENLINAFKHDLDIHQNTWKFIFWKDELLPEERKIAKAVNFWVIYWISPFWLSKMIWISQAEAKIYIEKFYETYPKVKDFFDEIIKNCEKNWYVQTMFWRKRFIVWINDKNSMIQKASQREAINMPIQWTSADIIKIAMIKIQQFLEENNLKSQMLMQVHDELVFNVKKDEFELLKTKITDIMENIIKSDVKLKVWIWFWNNWWEAK